LIRSSSGFITRDIIHKSSANDLAVSILKSKSGDSCKLLVKGVSHNPVFVDIYEYEVGLVFEDTIDIGKDFSRIYSFVDKVDKLTFVVTQQNN
jgi:hypothetical protein